ncbi:Uma2 family endonuclease [Cecembia sp.]|uniref:Uma2 family endonuclease n=1 Tax=Cecembia sp. TaxID=1898110 RepID=UPI0025BA8FDE|nr:Uma2 family endonuclease [Cecembia sp.]
MELGVKEYWIVYPVEQSLIIHLLVSGKYEPSRPFTIGDVVDSPCVEGFQMDLYELFQE